MIQNKHLLEGGRYLNAISNKTQICLKNKQSPKGADVERKVGKHLLF